MLKPLGLLVFFFSVAGYTLYTCSQYMTLGSGVDPLVRDLDAAEAICMQQVQCAANAPPPSGK